MLLSTRPAANDMVGATTTPDDDRPRRQIAVIQGAREPVERSGLSTLTLKSEEPVDPLSQSHPERSSSDHPILHLENLMDELDKDDAQDARTFIDLIKRNLEKGRDTEGPASLLSRLFAPVGQRITDEYESLSAAKQRVAEEYRRLSKDMTRAAEKKKLFDDAKRPTDIIKIED
jgi:hypothetical protein